MTNFACKCFGRLHDQVSKRGRPIAMAIHIEVLNDGRIDVYDTETKRWLEFREVRKVLPVVSAMLNVLIEVRKEEQLNEQNI
jgi:hypothetical protein